MKKVTLYTDGACSNNTKGGGAGGWGAILVYKNIEKEISGGHKKTTNNQMELQAVIEGLKLLREPCEVHIVSDSSYVLKGMTEWLPGWIAKNWKNSSNKDVKNREFWEEYLKFAEKHVITTEWVRGHTGHPMNERCDTLAVQQRDLHKS